MMGTGRSKAQWLSECEEELASCYGLAFVTIPLTQGYCSRIDREDYAFVRDAGPWHLQKNARELMAVRNVRREGAWTYEYLHRVLLNCPSGMVVHHLNHNELDNRRANLRIVTYSENAGDQHKTRRPTSSVYKGVHWASYANKWRATIGGGGRPIHLGYYESEEDAALAYNRAASIKYGVFATLNMVTR